LLESAPQAIVVVNEAGRIVLVNSLTEKLFGYTREELLGNLVDMLVPERYRARHAAHRNRYFSKLRVRPMGLRVEELYGMRKNGTEFPVEISLSPMTSEDGMLVSSGIIDITERKRAEEALRKSQANLAEAQQLARLGSWELDFVTNALTWSEEMYRIFEIPSAGSGTSYDTFLDAVHPDDRTLVSQTLTASVTNKTPYEIKHRILMKDGRVKHIHERGKAVYDAAGTPVRTVGTVQDITDYVRAGTERLKLEQQLRQAQKMESIGQLSGGIAHDFNNILVAVLGYTELAQTIASPSASPKVAAYLAEIHQAADRAKALVAQLLTFSRTREVAADVTQVAPVLNEVVKLFRATFPSTLSISLDMADALPDVHINSSELHQILMNLGINARDAMPDKGRLAIHAVPVSLDQPHICSSCHHDFQGEFIVVSIADTGHGIRPEHMSRLFEPFFTTKRPGMGTGLGLAVSHGIIHSAGGHVEVSSEADRGTEFQVYLQAMSAKRPGPPSQGGAGTTMPKAKGRVMVVDDEASVLGVTKDLLESIGCQVAGFTDPRTALSAFRKQADVFDLVVTDQIMPELTGTELARDLLKLRPDLPMILCTGRGDDLDAHVALDLGIRKYLLKPVPLAELARAVGELLEIGRSARVG